ncbi:ATP-binding cassette subfamily C protein CydCD [Actinomycetospora succinea]|uniref:ATP-binding cassette subfamily C protein CydCD n=1 Tax=Actinomycetospora succinea TaxID=663603 RepID=A0A4R6V3P8_9PSEU|nr:thiol reductant ABC exporter subunit CydD [Actinomycetospora succinea]TDQ52799.1 ATP-binding cassette subfamily C protein CydCD [Actinomycetospora succinea]
MKPLDPRLLRHVAPVRRHVVLCAGVGIATAGLVVVQADLVATAVTRGFLGGETLAALGGVLAALLAVVAGRALLAGAGEVAGARAAASVVAGLRGRLVAKALELGPDDPRLPAPSRLATLATQGVDGLDGYVRRYLPTLLVAAVVPLAVGARILGADWLSAVIITATVPLIPIFMILIGTYTQHAVARRWRTLAVLGHHFLDLVAGLDVLVAFGRARRQTGRMREIAERHRTATMATLRVAFLSALALELLATLSVALVAVAVGLRLVHGDLDLHTALLVIILAPEVYLPLRAVGARFHDSLDGLTAAQEAFAVLELAPLAAGERRPAPDPRRVPLRVREVGVAGRGGDPVLAGFSLTVAPGEVVGIAGPSGAGKTTLLDLLRGARRPEEGSVEVGGVDLAAIDPASWRERVAWVPQRPVLLAGTVASNLRLGAPSAADEAVAAAASAAALDVPLDTPVGDGGAGLSTGQRRRVALARALLADRPLLLLDEPTEGVDADTERAVLDALPGVLAGRSAVVVSHRAAVLELCDRVVTVPYRASSAPAVEPGARTGDVRRSPVPTPTVADLATPAPSVGTARWLARLLRPRAGRWALAVLLGAAAIASGVALTGTSAWLISTAALHPPVLTLMVAIVAVRAFGLARGVLRYAEQLVAHDAALRLGVDLRVRLWTALVRLGPAATARRRRGDLLARLVGDVDAAEDVVVRVALPATRAALVGVAAVVALALVLPAAGIALAVGLLVAGVVAPALALWAVRRAAARTAGLRGEVLATTTETLEAAGEILAFGAGEDRRRALAAVDDRLTAVSRRAAFSAGLGSGLGVLALGATAVATTALGLVALADGRLAGTALAVLALVPLACSDVVAGLPEAATRLATAGPAMRRLVELETAPAPVVEPSVPAALGAGDHLGADDLAVRWPGATSDVLHGVDLDLAPGGALVVAGPSGAGKSTLLAALARTLPARAGRASVDGVDVARCDGDDVRSRQAWCGPASHLFDSTLRENLLLARPDASDDDLVAVLGKARLGVWFAELPEGLDTPLGEHGGAVSGGERQRLGVARVLLADRPVLVLDEPAAHLDPDTADALCADLLAAGAGRTVLVVSHRPDEFPGLPVLRLGARERAVT